MIRKCKNIILTYVNKYGDEIISRFEQSYDASNSNINLSWYLAPITKFKIEDDKSSRIINMILDSDRLVANSSKIQSNELNFLTPATHQDVLKSSQIIKAPERESKDRSISSKSRNKSKDQGNKNHKLKEKQRTNSIIEQNIKMSSHNRPTLNEGVQTDDFISRNRKWIEEKEERFK